MKRFFCSVCKKVKRVRRLPDNVDQPTAENVVDRIGTCRFHSTHVGDGHVLTTTKGGKK